MGIIGGHDLISLFNLGFTDMAFTFVILKTIFVIPGQRVSIDNNAIALLSKRY